MHRSCPRLIWPAAFTLFAGAVLISLGVWQLHRREWKERLIAEFETRVNMPPQPLVRAEEWPRLRLEDYAYRHATAEGTFEHDKEVLVLHAGHPSGFHVITPLRLDSGGYVLVDRGFVPFERKDKASRLAGQITGPTAVTGTIRAGDARNLFTPDDNPALGLYYTRAPDVIAKQLGLAPAAPFILEADASPVPGGWPKGGTEAIALPNNHLVYALTWFSLAFVLLVMFAVFVRAQYTARSGSA